MVTIRVFLFCTTALLCLTLLVKPIAAEPLSTIDSVSSLESPILASDKSAQRIQFLEAERALARGDATSFNTILQKLESYPLYPYLLAQKLHKKLDKYSNKPIPQTLVTDVEQFIKQFSNTAPAIKIESQYLLHLQHLGLHAKILTLLPRNSSLSEEQQCIASRAALALDNVDEAWNYSYPIWKNKLIGTKDCEHVFTTLINNKFIDDERVWRKIKLLMAERHRKTTKTVASWLAAGSSKKLADFWLTKLNHLSNLASIRATNAQQERIDHVLADLVYNHAVRNPEKTKTVWEDLLRIYSPPNWSTNKVLSGFAIGYVLNRESSEAYHYFSQVDALSRAGIKDGWHIIAAIAENKTAVALKWLGELRPQEAQKIHWKYWQAKMLKASGRPKEAESIFKTLATERDYYGFLSADEINYPYDFNLDIVRPDDSTMQHFLQKPSVQRIVELKQLSRDLLARREWNILLERMDSEQLKLLAYIANKWDWHDRAILSFSKAKFLDDLVRRYPLPYKEHVDTFANENAIPKELIYSIMRQESAFMASAISSAGARGLMQLMPATARYVAKSLKLRRVHKNSLYNPKLNIQLGSAYLSSLMRQTSSKPPFAIASYNAGPKNISRWNLQEKIADPILQIELIPYSETRKYVKNVLLNWVIYSWRLERESVPRISSLINKNLPISSLSTMVINNSTNEPEA